MVRAVLGLYASSAAALEPTGLLQATVGMQSHLSAGSDKVSSLRRMEKEWQAAAKKKSQVADDVLYTIYDSMQGVLNETDGIFADIQNSLQTMVNSVTTLNTDTDDAQITTMAPQWTTTCNVLNGHKTCRDTETGACNDRDDECTDNDDVLTHCVADNPLCGCAALDNSAETMKGCLERAKAWYDNYHAAPAAIPAPAPRGYFLGALGASETRSNLTKEAQECADGTPVCNSAKSDCDEVQRAAQISYCQYNSMCLDECSDYQSAYSAYSTTYSNEVAAQLTDETSAMNNNIDVCKAAKKVICYINVIANKGYKHDNMASDRGTTYDLDSAHSSTFKQSSGEVDGSGYDYEFCLAYEPNCDNLSMPPPTLPPPLDCASFACNITISSHGLPESSGWFASYYDTDSTPECQYDVNFYLAQQPESLGATC